MSVIVKGFPQVKSALKSVAMQLARFGLRVLAVFPVKENRVMFAASSGAGYFCNPKYICEKLCDLDERELDIVWAMQRPDDYQYLVDRGFRLCTYRSPKYYYYRMTSRVYVYNAWFGAEVPKRANQFWIQTWHGGGCYKKVIGQEKRASSSEEHRQRLNASMVDVMLSTNGFFTREVIQGSFHYSGLIVPSGFPRNDFLVTRDSRYFATRAAVRDRIGIADEMLVLFAPTWRYSFDDPFDSVEVDRVAGAVAQRFGTTALTACRFHLHTTRREDARMMDVSGFDDMQELLAAADVLITDFSSSIWDYSFTEKPCFLLVPDLAEYERERGFYSPIRSWGFPVAESMDELVGQILNFDEASFRAAMDNHHRTFNSYEDGMASERVAELILSEMGEV